MTHPIRRALPFRTLLVAAALVSGSSLVACGPKAPTTEPATPSDVSEGSAAAATPGADAAEGVSPEGSPPPEGASDDGKAPGEAYAGGDGASTSPPPGEPPRPSGTPEGPKAKPKASATNLSGTLSGAQVAKFVEDHQASFDPCIAIAEKGGPVYRFAVSTRASVGPRGIVNESKTVKSSKNANFDKCVADAIKAIPFGVPDGGGTATITFPMVFLGAEEG